MIFILFSHIYCFIFSPQQIHTTQQSKEKEYSKKKNSNNALYLLSLLCCLSLAHWVYLHIIQGSHYVLGAIYDSFALYLALSHMRTVHLRSLLWYPALVLPDQTIYRVIVNSVLQTVTVLFGRWRWYCDWKFCNIKKKCKIFNKNHHRICLKWDFILQHTLFFMLQFLYITKNVLRNVFSIPNWFIDYFCSFYLVSF